MAKKDTSKQDAQLENVQGALSTAGSWVEKNQNVLSWTVIILLAIAAGAMLIKKYVIEPKREAADNENAVAMTYFLAQDYAVALNGNDDDCIGFAEIADKYSSNKGGQLAKYAAGVCAYQLGQYEDAIDYLKAYNTSEVNYKAASTQLLGDAYVQTGDLEHAAKCFEQVGAMNHDILSPMSLLKAANVYTELGNTDAALKAYKEIKEKYPQSEQATTAQQYIQ